MSDDLAEYEALVDAFARITGVVGDSGRCCRQVREDGAPWCCSTVAENQSHLEFTIGEVGLLWPDLRQVNAYSVSCPDDGIMLQRIGQKVYSQSIDQGLVALSLKNGRLSRTIECSAHPTRPIVRDGEVTGVASVRDCVAEWGLGRLLDHRGELCDLWTRSVELLGVKSYYVRHGGLVTL